MSNWFVAKTKPSRERLALANLVNQSINAFLPLRRCTRRRSGRLTEASAPLFPGYIFLRLTDERASWRRVNSTLGVSYLIAANERPTPLPSGFVEMLLGAADKEGVVSHAPLLRAGDRVEFSHGAFARQFGRILSMDDKGRVCVLLEMLSMQVPVKTRAEHLIPA